MFFIPCAQPVEFSIQSALPYKTWTFVSRANPGEGGGVTPSGCTFFVFEAMQPKFCTEVLCNKVNHL